MNFIDKMVERFIKLNRRMKRWQRVVSVMAAVVVFVTTYALILPAITLDRDTATAEPGIEVAASENEAGEAGTVFENAEEPAPEETAEEPEEAVAEDSGSESGSQEAEAAQAEAVAEENTSEVAPEGNTSEAAPADESEQTEVLTTEEAATYGTTEEAIAAVTGQTAEDVKLIAEDTQLTYDGSDYVVYADFGESAKLPEGVQLQVKEITKESDPEAYEMYYQKALSEMQGKYDENTTLSFAKFYDIAFVYEGVEIEPSGNVNVRIEYKQAVEIEETTTVDTIHFDKNDEEKAEVINSDTEGTEKEVEAVQFESDRFSVYGIVGTETIVIEYLSQDGETYQISIDIPAEANIPVGSELIVEELAEGSAKYAEYFEKAAKTLKLNKNEVSYIKLLDISIVKDGKEIQPDVPVSVSIELKDKYDASNTQVIHFEDEPVLMDADTNGNTVSFETPGFSVYAVVGGIDPTSRITVNFYGKDTGTPLATMYVKNEDDLEQVEKILFDPGAGTLDEGEIFRGWVIGDIAHEGTTATMPEYTVEMASTEGALKTIEDIREWAAAFDVESENHITEGDVVNIRAAIYKIYVITYLDDKDIAQSAENVLIMPDDTSAYYEYTINQSYTPVKDTVRFNGWEPTDETKGHITSDTQQQDNLYQKDDVIDITGNVDFKVNQSEGHWIVFHENGKGGTYNAPQFVERGNNTEDPGTMTRKGYTFGGWYTEVTGEADDHGYRQVVESSKFTFGGNLDDYGEGKLHLYAKWTPVTTAPYTVIFWGERIGDDGKVEHGAYEVLGSYVNNNGQVGQDIPYNSVDNGDEDYATGVGNNNGHYTGFNLTEASKGQQVTITPEGDAVLNLYYDRILYNFKFYVYRDGTQDNRYDYANNSENGRDLNGVVSWHSNQTQHPDVTADSGYTLQSETVGGRTYHYFVMPAYYGEDISAEWPTYDKLTGANGRVPVSYVMMVGTKLKPNPSSSGDGTVKGIVSVMNENILGATNNSNGNYVVIRYPDNYYNWRYHIWYETIPGGDYTGKTTHVWNGVTYYEDTVLTVRSSNTTVTNQNAPKYQGFDFIDWRGQNWDNRNYWNTTEGGTTLYNINEVYSRQLFKITYFDGNYVDGNGGTIQNKASQKLHESPEIPQGAVIPDEYKNYEPEEQEAGYIFKGWYLDEGCTVPYPWGTMPVGPENHSSAINVYAKWQQIQYRVYLQSNVPANEEFTWGSDDQATCFRVTYGDTVSLPVGRDREGWEFLGWYTTPNFEPSSRFTEDYALTEANVTLPYDQDSEYTDTYDKWGNLNDPRRNTDKDANRDWITKKLVLYAKWHQILEGAEGINIVYDPVLAGEGVEPPTGNNAPIDSTYYIDTALATAQAGSTADEPEKYQFECWVVQKWDGTAFVNTDIEVYPGDTFEVLKANAKEEDYTDPDNPQITKKYTVQLRAKYKPIADPTPTHIDWYKNYEEEGKHEAFHQDKNLKINQPAGIQAAPTRDGYSFVGWARVETERSHSHVPEGSDVPVADVLALGSNDVYIRWEEGVFKAKNDDGEWVEVTEVAADEKMPYHDMYAVWVKDYPITVQKNWENATGFENHIPDTVTVEILKNGESFNPKETITITKDTEGTWSPVTSTQEFPAFDADGNEIHYTVVETEPEGWKLESIVYGDNKEYVNQDNYSTAVEITNTRVNGSITLSKTISGLPDALVSELNNLQFYVKGPDEKVYGPYILSDFTESTESTGTYTLAPEDLAFVGPGEYSFYEGDADLLNDWGYELTDAAGTTVDTPVSITLSEGSTASGAITNAYERVVGDLVINKIVAGDPLPEDYTGGKFPYTVKIKNSRNWWLKGTGTETDKYDLTNSEEEAGVYEITTTKTLRLEDIPVGTYTVIEQGTDQGGSAWIENYELTVMYSANSVVVPKDSTGQFGTIDITNTYIRIILPVSVWKTDEDHNSLTGAEFTLYKAEDYDDQTDEPKSGAVPVVSRAAVGSNGILSLGDLTVGEYRLVENQAPAGYNLATSAIRITVERTRVTGLQSGNQAEVTQKGDPYWQTGQPDETWQVRVWNNPGVSLPNSGGPGTLLYTLGGLMLILASALMYGFRMRRGERRFK